MVVDRREWEQFLKDAEGLVEKYQRLIDKMKNTEAEKKLLEEKLRASEQEREELLNSQSSLEKRVVLSSQDAQAIREIGSSIARLLKDSEVGRLV